MDFKSKKISKNDHETQQQKKPSSSPNNKGQKTSLITIGIGLVIICVLVFGIFSLVKSLDFSSIIFSFGKSLKTDSAGHTNILLTGIGGDGHDGADLTDTIMVASIDNTNKLITLISIPRDLYVTNDGGEKINAVYEEGKSQINSAAGMKNLEDSISAITGLEINYYAKIDFGGFTKIVDSLGGVDVVVQKDIYDPYYPLGETTHYQTFSIKAGPQHLDGETALKYARSRETTTDFDRARRQQQILTAIKDKALSLNVLTDPSKIQGIYNSIQGSIETDMSVDEIIQFAKTAKDFSNENIVSHVISDNPYQCGGFLYSPAPENFGGAFVLMPAGKNYDGIQQMVNLIVNHEDVMKAQPQIQVLNGTKTNSLASGVDDYLSRMCFNVVYSGNADNKNHTTTTIYYVAGPNGEKPPVADLISKFLPYPEVAGIPPAYLNSDKTANTQVVIELGTDYLQNPLNDPFKVTPYITAPKMINTQAVSQQSSPSTQQ